MKTEYDIGFDNGHDLGYSRGFNEGFTWGKRNIIPESFGQGFNYAWSFSDNEKIIVEKTLNQLKSKIESVKSVVDDINNSLKMNKGLSIIRIGDGELMVMAQKMLPTKIVKLRGHMLWKHLDRVPDYDAADILIESIYKADWVGLPFGRGFPDCDVILGKFLSEHKKLTSKLTHSVINYRLYKQGYLDSLVKDRAVLLVGNTADELKKSLASEGYNIVGTVSPVKKIYDLDRAFSKIADYDFDIALVAAGVAAVPICVKVAKSLNKVAIDFGHMSDEIISK